MTMIAVRTALMLERVAKIGGSSFVARAASALDSPAESRRIFSHTENRNEFQRQMNAGKPSRIKWAPNTVWHNSGIRIQSYNGGNDAVWADDCKRIFL